MTPTCTRSDTTHPQMLPNGCTSERQSCKLCRVHLRCCRDVSPPAPALHRRTLGQLGTPFRPARMRCQHRCCCRPQGTCEPHNHSLPNVEQFDSGNVHTLAFRKSRKWPQPHSKLEPLQKPALCVAVPSRAWLPLVAIRTCDKCHRIVHVLNAYRTCAPVPMRHPFSRGNGVLAVGMTILISQTVVDMDVEILTLCNFRCAACRDTARGKRVSYTEATASNSRAIDDGTVELGKPHSQPQGQLETRHACLHVKESGCRVHSVKSQPCYLVFCVSAQGCREG